MNVGKFDPDRVAQFAAQRDKQETPLVEGGEKREMTWKRGLFRLWVLMTGLWIAFVVVTIIMDGRLPELEVLLLIIGAPVLLLGLGATTAWVISGFRDPN